jgi:hypothetical protein
LKTGARLSRVEEGQELADATAFVIGTGFVVFLFFIVAGLAGVIVIFGLHH